MKRFCTIGTRCLLDNKSPFSLPKRLARSLADHYPKKIIISDPGAYIDDHLPHHHVVVQSKKTLKHFLPLKDMTTDVFTDDPADIFAGRTYSDLLTGTMFRVQESGPHSERTVKQEATWQVAKDVANTGVETEIVLDHTEEVIVDNSPCMEVDGMLRTSNQLWVIKHSNLLTLALCTGRKIRWRYVKECMKRGKAVSHSNKLQGMEICLVMVGDKLRFREEATIEDWASEEGVLLYTRHGPNFKLSSSTPFTGAKPI